MGLILIPFLFGAFLIFIRAVWQLYPLIINQTYSLPGILLGIVIPLVLIKITKLLWIKEGDIYAFTPMFRYPGILFYIPFILSIPNSWIVIPFEITSILKSTLITWTVFSGFLIIPLMSNAKEWMKKNGVKFHY